MGGTCRAQGEVNAFKIVVGKPKGWLKSSPFPCDDHI
jgi:hypothetical protein